MKNTLLFLMLLLSGMVGAQIVNIPDLLFKNTLLTGEGIIAKNSAGDPIIININGDNEIQVSEALAVWDLVVASDGMNDDIISLTGMEAFINLRRLYISGFDITSLDCTALNDLQELKLDDLSDLETLNIHNLSHLATLDIPSLSNLKVINLNMVYDLTYLDLTDAINLEGLSLQMCGTPSSQFQLIMGNHPALRTMIFDSLDTITSFDYSGFTGLQYLRCTATPLTSLVIGDLPNLTTLNVEAQSNIQSLDLSGCTSLTNLKLRYSYVNLTNPGMPGFVNLKNGISQYEDLELYFYANDNSSPIYICIDEGNQNLIPATALANPNIQVSTYCSFTPGGNYNTITGTISFDADNNGCDGDDNYAEFVRLDLNNGIESLSFFANSGHYNFYPREGSYTITPQLENDWFTITPPSATINIATVDGSTTTQNFCISANGIHPDVGVVAVSGEPQPGFDSFYRIIYKNKGNQTLSGTLTLNYDDSVLDYVSAYPVEAASGTGSLTWNYTGLLPFESRYVDVFLNLNGPMETPAVNIGDVLAFSASVTPTADDETPADNTFALNQIVTGSFDPNDISCLEGRSVSPYKIGEYLHYNINFENNGTAPATFIVVKDMIDETKFDLSSLQLMNASHNIETRINGNKVEFIFDNINLGPEEKGNVTFKIKTLNTLQVNDDVTQQADIFFDYNWPIQTNEATTTFEVLSRSNFAMDNSVKVYPNPAKNIVTISADSNVKSVQLYDIQGRLLQSGTANDVHTTIDLSSRASGMYFVKVLTDKGIKVEKVAKE